LLKLTCIVVGLLLFAIPARAQREVPAVPASAFYEGRIDRAMKTGSQGVVVVDVRIPKAQLSSMHINVGRLVDGKLQRRSSVGSDWFFGKQTKWGAIIPLPAGDYMLLGALGSVGNHRMAFNGPYAKFTVRAGEVVDIGVLQLDHTSKMDEGWFKTTGTGTLHKSVQRMSPEARNYLKEHIPSYLPRMVSRPMTLLGPADTTLKINTRR
jgi:hypothetical protein